MSQVIHRLSNKNNTPLSFAQIEGWRSGTQPLGAPFAQDGVWHKRSDRYQPVNTKEIATAFEQHGLRVMEMQTWVRRNPRRTAFSQHTLRFGFTNGKTLKQVGDVIPQILMRNSHDGGERFELWGGAYRLACLNGLIVSDTEFVAPVRVRHSSRVVLDALMALDVFVEQFKSIHQHIDAMRVLKLDDTQQRVFAARALELRSEAKGVIQPVALLQERRAADKGNDLWRVFNRVQENLLRGGVAGKTAANHETKTREVQNITKQITLNANLWSLAMRTLNREKVEKGSVRVFA